MNNIKQTADEVGAWVEEAAAESTDKIRNELGAIKEKVLQAANKGSGYARENPWKCIFLFILLGVFVTLLLVLKKLR